MMNVVRVGQVHFFYRARLTSDVFDPGHETMEARLFAEEDIPWDEIAFRTVKETAATLLCRRQGAAVHAAPNRHCLGMLGGFSLN